MGLRYEYSGRDTAYDFCIAACQLEPSREENSSLSRFFFNRQCYGLLLPSARRGIQFSCASVDTILRLAAGTDNRIFSGHLYVGLGGCL